MLRRWIPYLCAASFAALSSLPAHANEPYTPAAWHHGLKTWNRDANLNRIEDDLDALISSQPSSIVPSILADIDGCRDTTMLRKAVNKVGTMGYGCKSVSVVEIKNVRAGDIPMLANMI